MQESEIRYLVIKYKDLDTEQMEALVTVVDEHQIQSRKAVVIESDWPGYDVALGIAINARICKQLGSCSCKTDDQRQACFDWVKV